MNDWCFNFQALTILSIFTCFVYLGLNLFSEMFPGLHHDSIVAERNQVFYCTQLVCGYNELVSISLL